MTDFHIQLWDIWGFSSHSKSIKIWDLSCLELSVACLPGILQGSSSAFHIYFCASFGEKQKSLKSRWSYSDIKVKQIPFESWGVFLQNYVFSIFFKNSALMQMVLITICITFLKLNTKTNTKHGLGLKCTFIGSWLQMRNATAGVILFRL